MYFFDSFEVAVQEARRLATSWCIPWAVGNLCRDVNGLQEAESRFCVVQRDQWEKLAFDRRIISHVMVWEKFQCGFRVHPETQLVYPAVSVANDISQAVRFL